MSGDRAERLERRLDREKHARREAESIAERVTAELYASMQELARLNSALTSTNSELQTVNQSMRDFVAIASHDLRTPLTAILGFSSMLKDRWEQIDEGTRAEMLATIERQGLHLNRMVEDLLTISKIEAGALDVHSQVVELRSALEGAIADFAQTAHGVKVFVPRNLSAVVDPDHLQRILVNFITNAFKYGEPPVEVVASEAGEWVEIRVSDCGAGVSEDFRARLFGRFARADTEATRREKGTGLGLSIVQGLAQANGGDTWFEPVDPHGSCFAIRLPKAVA